MGKITVHVVYKDRNNEFLVDENMPIHLFLTELKLPVNEYIKCDMLPKKVNTSLTFKQAQIYNNEILYITQEEYE